MTLQRHDGEVSFSCDVCDTAIDADDAGVDTFDELVEALKDDGWVFRQVDGQWVHFCPDHPPEF